jgi:hypothetical protein
MTPRPERHRLGAAIRAPLLQPLSSGGVLVIKVYREPLDSPIITPDSIGRLSPIDNDDSLAGFRQGLDRKRGAVLARECGRGRPAGMQLDADEDGRLDGLA